MLRKRNKLGVCIGTAVEMTNAIRQAQEYFNGCSLPIKDIIDIQIKSHTLLGKEDGLEYSGYSCTIFFTYTDFEERAEE